MIEQQIALLRTLGINENDSVLQRLLSLNSYNSEAAANSYFENGPPSLSDNQGNDKHKSTRISRKDGKLTNAWTDISNQNNKPAVNAGNIMNPILLDDNSQDTEKRLEENIAHFERQEVNCAPDIEPSHASHYFIGRRTCLAYSLSAGFAQRSQCLELIIEDGGYQKTTKSASKASKSSTPAAPKKEKYAGAKLIVEARIKDRSDVGAFRSRLPNIICDFLVPLLQAGLILCRGHVAYDIGNIKLMQDVPVSLQIFIAESFLDLTEPGSLTYRNCAHLTEAANDLLLWLHEGESAVAAVRKQRQVDADARQTEASRARESALVSGKDKGPSNATSRKDEAGDHTSADADQEPEPEVTEEFSALVSNVSKDAAIFVLPEAQQPDLMLSSIKMRKYQLQALHWMKQRESIGRECKESASTGFSLFGKELPVDVDVPHEGLLSFKNCHASKAAGTASDTSAESDELLDKHDDSVWQSVPAVAWNPVAMKAPQDTAQQVSEKFYSQIQSHQFCRFYWNVYSQRISRLPPPAHHQVAGGVLADEMGLGKTLMAVSLIAADYTAAQTAPDSMLAKSVASSKRTSSHSYKTSTISGNSSNDSMSEALEDAAVDYVLCDTPSESEEEERSAAAGRTTRARAASFTKSNNSNKRRRIKLIIEDEEGTDNNEEEEEVAEVKKEEKVKWQFSIPKDNIGNSYVIKNGDITSSVRNSHATLIVCPLSLMNQWAEEVCSKTQRHALRVMVYYGAPTASGNNNSTIFVGESQAYTVCRDPQRLGYADVVITSYGVLVSDCRAWLLQQEMQRTQIVEQSELGINPSLSTTKSAPVVRPGLLRLVWHRVILDEAHFIKNHHTETARACYTLNSVHRWALTGTPLQNTIDDLYSLVRFLGHEPWCEYRFWKKVITDPYKAGDQAGMQRLHVLLSDLLLRRTKTSKDSEGEHIVNLPPRFVHVVPVLFDKEEGEFYQAIVDRSKSVFHRFEGNNVTTVPVSGNGVNLMVTLPDASVTGTSQAPASSFAPFVLKNKYAALFTLLMRMRQACDHPTLVIGKLDSAAASRFEQDSNEVNAGIKGTGNVVDDTEATAGESVLERTGMFGADFLDQLFQKMQNARKNRLSSARKGINLKPVCSVNTLAPLSGDLAAHSTDLREEVQEEEEVDANDPYMAVVMKRLHDMTVEGQTFECPICITEDVCIADCAITRCGHLLCVPCAQHLWPTSKLALQTPGTSTSRFGKSAHRVSAHPATLRAVGSAETPSLCPVTKCPMCSDHVPANAVFALAPLRKKLLQQQAISDVMPLLQVKAPNMTKASESAVTDFKMVTTHLDAQEKVKVEECVSQEAVAKDVLPTTQKILKLSELNQNWRHWGDMRYGLSAPTATGEAYVTSSKLEAVIGKLQFILDPRRDDETWEKIATVQELPLVCAECGIHQGDPRLACTVSPMSINSSSIKSFGDSGAAERTSTVYSSACTFRCMKCPDLRYCDSCFALHNCAPSKCSSSSSRSSSSGSNALKVVVFSQWTSMLDLLVPVLQAHKLQFSRLDGKMSQAQRARSIGIFNKDPSVRILLASLKAGGVGLNLTVASHVLLVDPW